MNYSNNGSEEYILQNKFTAFLRTAVRNRKISFLRSKHRREHLLIITEVSPLIAAAEEDGILLLAERDALARALNRITEREKFVLISRVIEEKSFEEIGAVLGLTYGGAVTLYHRTILKLRALLGGETT